jgi:hypothetical protein
LHGWAHKTCIVYRLVHPKFPQSEKREKKSLKNFKIQ